MHTLANDSEGTGRTNRSATACNSWNFAAILSVVLGGDLDPQSAYKASYA